MVLVGCCSDKGKNKKNEDRFVALKSLPSDPSSSFFGVFDGHGGDKASTYCQKHLHENITTEECYASNKRQAIISGFTKTDKKFLKKMEDSGTTAVCCLLTQNGKQLYVGNTGDSRCIISCKGQAIPLSKDHKPSDPAEQKRIESTEHKIVSETILVNGKRTLMYRIDGVLAVSRAIGDGDFKDKADAGPEAQAITCVPDVEERALKDNDEFLVLACDGLWDVMTNQEVVDFVSKRLTKDMTDEYIQTVAEQLVSYAIKEKSSPDNVTAVVVVLNDVKGASNNAATTSTSSSKSSSESKSSRSEKREKEKEKEREKEKEKEREKEKEKDEPRQKVVQAWESKSKQGQQQKKPFLRKF